MIQRLKSKTYKALRWSERYTKTDMVYITKNSFWVFIGQVASSASAFIATIVIANLVSKETFGEYRFLISIVTLLALFSLPGLNTALTQSTARGHDGQLSHIVRIKQRWSFFASLFSILFALYYWFIGNNSLSTAFVLLSFVMPFYVVYFSYHSYLHGKKKFNEASILQTIGRLFFLFVIITTAHLSPTSTALIAAFTIGNAIAYYFGYIWTTKKYIPDQVSEKDKDILGYGKHLSWLGILGTLSVNLDKILVWHFLGATPLAMYSVALLFPQESNRIGKVLYQIALPKLSDPINRYTFPIILRKIVFLEIALMVAWIAYFFLAPVIFKLFLPNYLDAIPYSIIAMIAILIIPSHIIRAHFAATKYKQGLNITLIIIPIFKTVILFIGLVYWGIWGATWAFAISNVFDLLIHICNAYYLHTQTNRPIQ